MTPKTVDEYISSVPEDLRDRLKEIRKIIKTTVPEAQEKISYGMPYYGYKGRLAYFRLAKHHIGLYIPGSALKQLKEESKGYETSTATIRLPHDKKLPIGLIKKLIKARKEENDNTKNK